MRALTIRQPWADAIVHGTKRTENRTWPAPASAVGSRILIHAGNGAYDLMGRFLIDRAALAAWPDERGTLIATATLTNCHHAKTGGCCAPWGQLACWHWTLTDVTPLPHSVPCRGRQHLWVPPTAVLAAETDDGGHRDDATTQ